VEGRRPHDTTSDVAYSDSNPKLRSLEASFTTPWMVGRRAYIAFCLEYVCWFRDGYRDVARYIDTYSRTIKVSSRTDVRYENTENDILDVVS
jgi:hypothetical protein